MFWSQRWRRGDAALVAEVPEGGAELEGVLRRTIRRGLAFVREPGESLVHLLALKRWAEFDHALDRDPGFVSE